MDTGLADRCFQLLDLFGIFDLYELISNLLTPKIRRLTEREEQLLRSVYGDSVPYASIRIDERARLGPRHYGIYYVSFHTINAWGDMSDPILVHEVMHIWQYVHFGALYIPRALAAQRSRMGYDYGGRDGLSEAQRLDDFNYEQAAAVVEDAFRLSSGYPLRYGSDCTARDYPLYERYLRQVRQARLSEAYRD